MKRFFTLVVFLVMFAAPAAHSACINTQAGDWDDCSERRRPGREPGAWCGGGGGSSPGGSWRQRQQEAVEEGVAKIKASIEALTGGVLLFKPSADVD
jgi:hypothetical protein